MLTLEQLNEFDSVFDAIEFYNKEMDKIKIHYIPKIEQVYTKEEANSLLDTLKYYISEYEKTEKEAQHNINLIQEFIKEKAGLNNIPDKYKDNVYKLACKKGIGHYDVYNFLCELVKIFE